MRPLDPLTCVPPALRAEVARLRDSGELASRLARRYPARHDVRGDRALYEYVQRLKARHLRSAPPVDRVSYDARLDVAHRALGLHTARARVHGKGLRATREIRVASLFEELAPELLEMIVVHELAHLRHREHDKAFDQLCVHMQPSYHQREQDARLYLVLAASAPAALPEK
ncbi:MAG: M48 family metallopeptidase [Polyangiaceae bacterium]|nr:M48 family metallopeptidase [Polyangiaceae bacterium]